MSTGESQLLAGRYRIVEQLGRGGMGVVWRAHDEVLGRDVAVKELRAYNDASAPELGDLRLRMQREARAAARIRHPSVVAVHDVTEHQGRPVIVMELIDGPSLDDVLTERGALEPAEAAAIGATVLQALAAAHRAGVLHRDVKPGNILLDTSGRVVLTDFGIAAMDDPGDGSGTHLTRSGELVGSLDYLAPERAQGHTPGPPSDIWALGATLYAAVEGTAPFRRTSTWSTLNAIVVEPPSPARRAGPLGPVLLRLMDKDPARRPDAETAARLLTEAAATTATTPTAVRTTTLRTTPGRTTPGRETPAHPTDAPRDATVRDALPHRPQGFGPAPATPTPTPPLGPAPAPRPPHHDGTAPVVRDLPQHRTTTPGRRRRTPWIAAAAGLVVLAGGGAYALLGPGDTNNGQQTAGATADTTPDATDDQLGAAGLTTPHPTTRTTPNSPRPATSSTTKPSTKGDPHTADDTKDGKTPGPRKSAPDAAATATPGSAAPPAGSCRPATGSRFDCEVWRTARSIRSDGSAAGVLNAGTNYFYCQTDLGRRETYGKWTNTWWARTDDDSGHTNVYISVVYMKGGDNNQPAPGLKTC
ncbi:serine/threonine-protein kinase [Streptomyces sp. NBC_00083]|uniref:serine/threonine-protein kinase n=1 Tax=Streptomyces sp. NBC_00083 TaxID=2975647 RepID=UPI00224D3650|nr:serine/threonine-protein kinase [Streptomyces sp. NBC_00083]MCX5383874.1 serine/threonine protein kinase [Streptomyces sp. NBC_00083]